MDKFPKAADDGEGLEASMFAYGLDREWQVKVKGLATEPTHYRYPSSAVIFASLLIFCRRYFPRRA